MKESSKCGTAALLNRLRNDGSVLGDACKYLGEFVLSLAKMDKEWWNKKFDAQKTNEEHKIVMEGQLASFVNLVKVLHSMFWSWDVKVLELAAAEAGSDASGLDDVFYHLLNEVGDVAGRKMRLPNFPSYKPEEKEGLGGLARLSKGGEYNDGDDTSSSSESDSDENEEEEEEEGGEGRRMSQCRSLARMNARRMQNP